MVATRFLGEWEEEEEEGGGMGVRLKRREVGRGVFPGKRVDQD